MTSFALRVTEGHARAYRHVWSGTVYSTFLGPLLYLGAMGLGLGSLVERGDALPGGSYLAFVAPGLLAASAMQVAAQESAFPVMAGLKWRGTYKAALSTPLRPADLVLGHVVWIGLRLCMTSSAFFLVMLLFGAAVLPHGLLAVPAAVLVGLATAAPVIAFTGRLENDYALSGLFRFVLVPLFLISGTFFPLQELPGWIVPVAQATPVWHGVELARAAAAGIAPAWPVWLHLAVPGAWLLAGAIAAAAVFERRLRT